MASRREAAEELLRRQRIQSSLMLVLSLFVSMSSTDIVSVSPWPRCARMLGR